MRIMTGFRELGKMAQGSDGGPLVCRRLHEARGDRRAGADPGGRVRQEDYRRNQVNRKAACFTKAIGDKKPSNR